MTNTPRPTRRERELEFTVLLPPPSPLRGDGEPLATILARRCGSSGADTSRWCLAIGAYRERRKLSGQSAKKLSLKMLDPLFDTIYTYPSCFKL